MKVKHYALPLLVALLLAGCSGQFRGMPREEVLAYQTTSTYGQLYQVAYAYAQAINSAVDEDTLHPGMYADYGVALALMGHRDEACRMLNAEMQAFPESYSMVQRIKQSMMPELADVDESKRLADTLQLQRWAYDSLSALRPLPNVASIIDSTDTLWSQQQTPADSVLYPVRLTANQKREQLAQQQAEIERLRQARIDSIANVKQAKIDARKQAKVDKEKAKKQKVKAKKKAEKQKKQLEKQRQKERQQQAAAAEKAKKQQAAEKERLKKEQAAEKERIKQEQAAEKERIKQEQAAEKERIKQEQAAEKERIKQEQAAEKERIKQEQAAEKERIKQEQAAEKERIKQEQAAAKKAQAQQDKKGGKQ